VGEQAATQLTGRVMQFADRVSSGVVGSVGFALLAWTLLGTIKKVEDSFNFLWRVEQPRSFARRIAEYLTLIVVGPLLLVAFIGLSHATIASVPVQTVAKNAVPAAAARNIDRARPVRDGHRVLHGHVHVCSQHPGAMARGAGWRGIGRCALGRRRQDVHGVRRLLDPAHVVYAGFAFIVAALLWTYFGWLILLAGAQLSFYIQNPTYLKLGLQELRLSCVEREQLALKMMYLVGRTHLAGGKRWTVNQLSRELACRVSPSPRWPPRSRKQDW